MNLPVYERRFFLGLLTREATEQQARNEEMRAKAKTSGGKGNRTTRVSGAQLKSKLQSGEIPLK